MARRSLSPPSRCGGWSFTPRWASAVLHKTCQHVATEARAQLSSAFVFPACLLLQLGLSPLLFCEDEADAAIERERTTSSPAEQTSQKEAGASATSRLCSLQKGPLGFGFNLGCVPQRPGTFISQVRREAGRAQHYRMLLEENKPI